MVAGVPMKQRASHLEPPVLAYVSSILGIERSVRECKLQIAHVKSTGVVEAVALHAYRFIKPKDPISHSLIACTDTFEIWRAGEVLCIDRTRKRYRGRFSFEALRPYSDRCSDDQSQNKQRGEGLDYELCAFSNGEGFHTHNNNIGGVWS